MTGRGYMRICQWVLVLTLLSTMGSLTAADPFEGVVGNDPITVHTIRMVTVPTDAAILIIGHLTRNGNAIEGTSFSLDWDPSDPSGSTTSHDFSIPVDDETVIWFAKANGVQIAYILGPNALVNFTIASDQFVVHAFSPDLSASFVEHPSRLYTNTWIWEDWLDTDPDTDMRTMKTGTRYILPHLPEDPDGEAAIAFF
jgi:hypothetical protein